MPSIGTTVRPEAQEQPLRAPPANLPSPRKRGSRRSAKALTGTRPKGVIAEGIAPHGILGHGAEPVPFCFVRRRTSGDYDLPMATLTQDRIADQVIHEFVF